VVRVGLIGVVGSSAFEDRDQGYIECLVVDRPRELGIPNTRVQADQAFGTSQQSVAVVHQRLAVFGRVVFE